MCSNWSLPQGPSGALYIWEEAPHLWARAARLPHREPETYLRGQGARADVPEQTAQVHQLQNFP